MAAQETLLELHAQLDAFVRWFGAVRLDAAQTPLRALDLNPLRYTRQLQRQWVVRDLLMYLAARTCDAVDEPFVFEHLMPSCRLASAVPRFERAGAMQVRGRFRDLLLGEACANYAHEVMSAARHDWRGYEVRWLPDGAVGGEFAVRFADDADDVFVECKRLAADLVKILKTDDVTALSDTQDHAPEARG